MEDTTYLTAAQAAGALGIAAVTLRDLPPPSDRRS